MKDFAIKFGIVALCLGIVGWWLLDYHYRGVTKELNERSRLETAKQAKLDTCITDAWSAYESTRTTQCAMYLEDSNCSLSMELELALRETLENDKNRCVTLYK